MIVTIELALPREAEHPNARVHWAKKAKAVAQSRGEATTMTLLAMRREGIKEPIKNPCYKMKFCLPRKRDDDGLIAWVKAQIDGIASAGLIKNDSNFRLQAVEQLSGYGATGGRFGVTYTIWSNDESRIDERADSRGTNREI